MIIKWEEWAAVSFAVAFAWSFGRYSANLIQSIIYHWYRLAYTKYYFWKNPEVKARLSQHKGVTVEPVSEVLDVSDEKKSGQYV